MIDSRAARVLTDGARDMVDADEWQWISEHTRGAYDHLIIASTLPVFMLDAIHDLEAWNEAVCAGAWGRVAARLGEKLRRAFDLEHWPAFQRSFRTMLELLRELAEGPDAPGTITFIGGDVHTAYIAEVTLGDAQQSRIFQIVCSPFRNPLRGRERRTIRLLQTRAARAICRRLARAAGVAPPDAVLAHRDARDVRELGGDPGARRAARSREHSQERARDGRRLAARGAARARPHASLDLFPPCAFKHCSKRADT